MVYKNKGITLIALVITIIVLLILAGVSIAMLTGENGVLTNAESAKTETEKASAKEKVQLAALGSHDNSGKLNLDQLKEEVTNEGGTVTGDTFPVTVSMDGHDFEVDSDRNVTEKKKLADITGDETANTVTQDSLGNPIRIPAGFEVVNPTDNVTDGIIIKDKTHTATAGSEFVWIPVGTIKTDNNGGKKTIKLSRYTFDETTGAPTDQGDAAITSGDYNYQELASSDKGNTVAKDIEAFKAKANASHGYYLARYEARKATERSSSTTDDNLKQITTKPNDYVYNWVTQPQAATLSRGMYEGTPFESDLINSYAWDTATLFLQTIDNRTTDKNKKYSIQSSLNSSPANKGTNNLTEASKQDKICNIYDMASNCFEWSTETYSRSGFPCTERGGCYNNSGICTGSRSYGNATDSHISGSFRPLLYL